MLNPLSKVQNLKDPLKQFVATWQIVFDSQSPLSAKINAETLELRCQTFSMPNISGDTTVVNWGGFERTYAGKQTRAGDWSVTFTEVWNSAVMDMFKEWVNQYHDYKDGTISLLNSYTATVNVALVNPDVYDPKPEGLTRYDMRLFDVFPTTIDLPQINASSSDPVEITANFHYNYFLMGNELDN